MKTLPAVAAVSIAMALLLVPLASTAAGSITFSSPAAGASYSGSQAYTIAGTVSPAPTQPDNVGIVVKNPAGQIVDQDTASVTNGAFSYSTAVGGTSSWTSGTYTITATDSFGATGTTTFTFAAAGQVNQQQLLQDIMGNITIIQNELKTMNSTINSNHAAIGNLQTALNTLTTNVGQINTAIGTLTTNVASISSAVTGLTNSVGSITSSLATLTTDVTNLQNSLTSISSTLQTVSGNIGSAVSAANTAATQATNASNAVSSTQTYVLVVAVLAAITLVLELAILVRKVS